MIEAFAAAGRSGHGAGGVADLVEDGVSGVLVPLEDAGALARALAGVLGDRALAELLGGGVAGSGLAGQPLRQELGGPHARARRPEFEGS